MIKLPYIVLLFVLLNGASIPNSYGYLLATEALCQKKYGDASRREWQFIEYKPYEQMSVVAEFIAGHVSKITYDLDAPDAEMERALRRMNGVSKRNVKWSYKGVNDGWTLHSTNEFNDISPEKTLFVIVHERKKKRGNGSVTVKYEVELITRK